MQNTPTYTPFSILRGAVLVALVWPAMLFVLIKEHRVKKGTAQRLPFDSHAAFVMGIVSIPCTLALYTCLVTWWMTPT